MLRRIPRKFGSACHKRCEFRTYQFMSDTPTGMRALLETSRLDDAMTRSRRHVQGGGRPRLDRDRHLFYPVVEVDLIHELKEQAGAVQMKFAPYLELLLAEAHDYHGQYLQELATLPAAVQAPELRTKTAALDQAACVPLGGPGVRATIRVDRPLADQITRRCEELDALYAEYLRAIFREAAGRTGHFAQHHQLAVEIDKRGEVTLPIAG